MTQPTGVPRIPCDLLPSRYPSVDELTWGFVELADEAPHRCTLRKIGSSRAGEPILLLSVGQGAQDVLVVAGAHSNEPVGPATGLALARMLTRHPELLESTGLTWHFLACLDPDGARLHRTAPRVRQSFVDHHRGFFRPIAVEQPELAPSVRPPGDDLPETRALAEVIDELRPALQCSLHGIDVGGTWVQVTRELLGLSSPFLASAERLDIPVERGSFDSFYWPETEPAVFVMPPPGEHERFSSHVEEARETTWYLPHRHGGMTALLEVPMWASELLADTGKHEDPLPAVLDCAERLRRAGDRVAELVKHVTAEAPDGPLLRSAQALSDLCPVLAEDWDALARGEAPPPPVPLSNAHISALEAQTRRLPLRAASMLLHLLDDEQPVPVRRSPVHETLHHLVDTWCADYAAALQIRWVPVERQVEHQLRTALTTAGLVARVG